MLLDPLAQLNFAAVGQDEDIHITADTTLTSPIQCRNLIVDPGVTLTVTAASIGAQVWANGDIRIEGTIKPSYPFIIPPGTTPSLNWDGATSGGNGSAIAGGTAGAQATGTPTLHDLLYNGHYNTTPTDYRWFHLLQRWGNPGSGGNGFNGDTGTANVQGGLGGGNLLMVARGIIVIDDSAGGVVDCSGANGAGGNPLTGTAQGGAGGGAGGIAILISFREIFNLAGSLIDCSGGNGGKATVGAGGRGAGGGASGGGGLVAMIAPVVNQGLGSYSIAPGTIGTGAIGGGAARVGGGGSGGSFGPGGAGGNTGGTNGASGGAGDAIIHEGWTPWAYI